MREQKQNPNTPTVRERERIHLIILNIFQLQCLQLQQTEKREGTLGKGTINNISFQFNDAVALRGRRWLNGRGQFKAHN